MKDWQGTVELLDPVERIAADVEALGLVERSGWTTVAVSDRLAELLEVRDRLEAEITRIAADWQRRRGWEHDGALSPVAWLTHRTPIGRRDAHRLVQRATVIDTSPDLAAALHTGDTTAAHLDAVARVTSQRRRRLLADHGPTLTELATDLPISDFTTVMRRWAALADDHLTDDQHRPDPPRNRLHAAVTIDGRLDGTFQLDPVAGATLLGVLDHLAPPDPADAPDGPRTLAERRGDALADLAVWYHRGTRPDTNPPNLDIVVDVATLNGDTPHLAKRRCDLEGVGPVTRATLEQLQCNATIRRVITAGDSIILDMGRKTRYATAAQTRAVRLRDTGCIFPSCNRPAPWCDIHHVTPWSQGGTTDLANLCCLCRRHHTLIHTTRWTITPGPNGTPTITHPTRGP